ncbi:MAG: UDP-glucose/GDP-mannose dehydrogenase family protein [Paludibacteraceae bacterium]|nr:UDP-glucose/GDP-mannose dehydrogenase family protein [Paludibacteraceae bacterium]
MNIAIVGTGYVGLVTGACFAKMGHNVWCVDIDKNKIEGLKCGIIPIYEPGLEEIVRTNYQCGRLKFVTDLSECISEVNFIFSAVGTPPNEDGSADLKYVLAVAKRVGELAGEFPVKDVIFVTKSTVPVGTAEKVKNVLYSEIEKHHKPISIHVASNPEFLKEGSAVNDFMKPDRIVVGVEYESDKEQFEYLYKPFVVDNPGKLIFTDVPSAEMIKYAANSMLATRISFMNEIANLCDKVGANIDSVRMGIGTDTRIGKKFLYAGCGYGGSCFPKDVKALIKTGMENGEDMLLLNAVEKVNREQKSLPLVKTREELEGFTGKKILVWGLAFKPETDDIREAPSLTVLESLALESATVYAYDPVAKVNTNVYFTRRFGNAHYALKNINYISDKFDCDDCDAIILLTEWNEFRDIDWDYVKEKFPSCKVVFDGRNIYDRKEVEKHGFKYFGIGK